MYYKVCEARKVAELSDEVNLYMEKGWSPQGGIFVVQSNSTGDWWFYQAMVLDHGESLNEPDPELT